MSEKKNSGFKVLRPAKPVDEKTLVVLGSPRGGTSMLAGLLRELGFFMGDRVDRYNHEDWAFLTDDVEQIRATIAQRNEEHPVWGWKVPDSIHYLPEIAPDLRNPHYLVVFRNPIAVASSMQRYTEDLSLQTALRRALEYFVRIEEFLAQRKAPVLLVSYEAAVADPKGLIEAIGQFVHQDFDAEEAEIASRFVGATGGYRTVRERREPARVNLKRVEAQPKGNWAPRSFSLTGINIDRKEDWWQSWNKDPQLLLDLSTDADHLPKPLLLGFDLDWETGLGPCQLFLDLGWGFGKQLRYEIELEKGSNLFLIEPSKPVLKIRLDPTDDDAKFRIHNLRLLQAG